MAKYDVNYSCGHTARIELYGKETERERKIAFYEQSGVCPDCYKKGLEEQKEKANADAIAKATEMNLPVLQGSEKQVAWATTIRQKMIDEFNDARIQKFIATMGIDKSKFENIISTETSAKYYIDNRDTDIRRLAR